MFAVPATVTRPALRLDVHVTPAEYGAALREDVVTGLTSAPKSLRPKWLYDERGSELFEAITRLPEYYPTRRERSILVRHGAEIAAVSEWDTLVELGSGASEKTLILLDALAEAGGLNRFVPLDVCEEALVAGGTRIADGYPDVEVHALVGDFERHLPLLPAGGRRLVAFLGSTLGNLVPEERAVFLADLRATLAPGDGLLLGLDLVKDVSRLEAAYDDSAGVTAAFNRNLLARLNRELGATFELSRFEHVARFDPESSWVELSLRSTHDQIVAVWELGLSVAFRRGEEMRTEVSTKFRREGVERELRAAGFELARWWTDRAGDYSVSLSLAR